MACGDDRRLTNVAVVNEDGGYEYYTDGEIKVGDGFFVKAVSKDASLSYNGNLTKRSETVNEEVRFINIITSDKNGKDNVVINLTDEEQEGFPKISNLNESIANVYVPYNDRCYGVYNCNNEVKEVEVPELNPKIMAYKISDECIACGACADACPVGAISGEVRKPHTIDQAKCIKCEACLTNCPFKAIVLE